MLMNRRLPVNLFLLLLTSGLFALLLAACNTAANVTPTPIYTRLTESSLAAGDPIPVPANEADIILTVTGKISRLNQAQAIVMDLATIEQLGEVEYTLDDPFLEERVTYRGVLLGDLLNVWGVSAEATTLHMIALNDYEVDVPIEDFEKMPVVYALRINGDHMPVSTRGPAMLVYPYDHFNLDKTIYNNYWIWQIKSIDVR
jgi:hypothetical protein